MSDLPEKVVSTIPYFFFDLFGRIIPGLYLLCGLVFAFRNGSEVGAIVKAAHQARTAEWILAGALLSLASFGMGLVLSTLSRALWPLAPSFTISDLRKYFGREEEHKSIVESVFERHFGFQLDHSRDKKYFMYCSRLCHLAVVSRHSTLDTVVMRIDAEELFSRSGCIASLLLSAAGALNGSWTEIVTYFILAVILFDSFRHYNAKAIRERFQMFLVLWPPEHKS